MSLYRNQDLKLLLFTLPKILRSGIESFIFSINGNKHKIACRNNITIKFTKNRDTMCVFYFKRLN